MGCALLTLLLLIAFPIVMLQSEWERRAARSGEKLALQQRRIQSFLTKYVENPFSIRRHDRLAAVECWNGPVDLSRIDLFERTTGLVESHARMLRFDGKAFHSGGGDQLPLESVLSVSVSFSHYVITPKTGLPSVTRWRFSRMDGGPDLRYSGNSSQDFSSRIIITFTGPVNLSAAVFSSPDDFMELHSLADKAKAAAAIARSRNFAEWCRRYDLTFPAFASCLNGLDSLKREKSKLQVAESQAALVAGRYNPKHSALASLASNRLAELDATIQREERTLSQLAVPLMEVAEEIRAELATGVLAINDGSLD